MSAPDLQSKSPAEVYSVVAEMEEDEFEELMQEPDSRELVIDAMVDHMVSRFRPEAAEGIDAVIQIKLWDRPGGGYEHVELRIADGGCTLEEPSTDDPDLTLKVRPTDLRKLVTGDTGPRRLALKGRLRALGDLGLGMKLPNLFEL